MPDMQRGMIEVLTATAACVGTLGSVLAAWGVSRVNTTVDRFIGRVQALETAHHSHVDMPGLHGAR